MNDSNGSGRKLLKRDAPIRTIPLKDVRVSSHAQRDVNKARVAKILEHLDYDLLGTFTVSHRDGYYWLVDGQHRFQALKEYWGEDYGEWEIQAWCYTGLTEEQEAERFLKFNETLAVDSWARFKVGVTAGRAAECDVNRIVLSQGLHVSRQPGPNSVTAVGTLMKIYRLYGASALQRVLATLRDSLGDDYSSWLLEGLAVFYGRVEGRCNPEHLIERMALLPRGSAGIRQAAYLLRERLGETLVQCVAAILSEVHDQALPHSKRIGSWWKEDEGGNERKAG